jgi:hypothetical protein
MNTLRRWVGLMAVVAVAGVGPAGCAAGVEDEETGEPQEGLVEDVGEVAQADVHCGGNIDSWYSWPNNYQRLTYISCSSNTLYRKADIANGSDGPCKIIGPYQTVVLVVIPVTPLYIRGSKPC